MMEQTLHERVGGTAFFVDLVERFYAGIESVPAIRPLYPDDLGPGKRALALFLAQYWGGPTTYSDEKGHPRLRMRHFPFTIGPAERDRWLHHMSAAVAASSAGPTERGELLAYFEMAATAMINAEG